MADINILTYGATPDTLCTEPIQNAINACAESGGGRVTCGPGRFLTGSLILQSNVELHLSAGCQLIGSTSIDHYENFTAPGFKAENAPEGYTKHLIRASHAKNISITGPGELNGSGLSFYDTTTFPGPFFKKPTSPRPFMVLFYKCQNIRIENASFIDSPCWTFWLMKCEHVHIHRIHISGDQRMINNDGIDIDSCQNVTISDCIIKTSDDCLVLRSIAQVYDEPGICENVTISNCILDSWCQGVRIGCPGDHIIRNCTFTNLTITSINNGILFEYPHRYLSDGHPGTADIHNILFSNVIIHCKKKPISIRIEDGIKLPRIAHISFTHFNIHSHEPITIQGSPQTPIQDIRLNNITLHTTGDNAIVCKHCHRITLTNVELSNG